MEWLELNIDTSHAGLDAVTDMLEQQGVTGLIIDDEADFQSFLENNRQYWDYVDEELERQMTGLSQIRLYLEDGPAAPETIGLLRSQLPALRAQHPSVEFGSLEVALANVRDEDWENSWKQYYQPLPIGKRLLVVPEWLHPENPEQRVEVLLDPGMIFGTGAHASTQMCMRELEHTVHGGERVLDLGSGYDIVLANIVADVIIPLSPIVPRFLTDEGVFICSGILDVRFDEVAAAIERAGMTIVSSDRQEDWRRITAKRTV